MHTGRQGLLVAVIVPVVSAAALAQTAPTDVPLVLTGARVYASPHDPVIESGAVVIRNGRIVYVGSPDASQVPKDASVIDCTGRTVTAGFWNSHVHFAHARHQCSSSQLTHVISRASPAALTRPG